MKWFVICALAVLLPYLYSKYSDFLYNRRYPDVGKRFYGHAPVMVAAFHTIVVAFGSLVTWGVLIWYGVSH